MIQLFTLTQNKQLTDDVYELIFEGENEISMKPGQFITFLIEKIGGRAYSILKASGKKIHLIIKKRELSDIGRGGSKYLCEMQVGDQVKGVGPAGTFLLKETQNNKMFIATGTGMVPLYNQIIKLLESEKNINISFIFGVRTKKDLFYLDEYKKLADTYSQFNYHIYLSRDEGETYYKGYVTDFLTKDNIHNIAEFYICGANTMIDSSVEKLKSLGVLEENILFERYS